MRLFKIVQFVLVFLLSSGLVFAENITSTAATTKIAEEFPARKFFPTVPHISLDELYKNKAKYIIVDVRSKYEFETLRIKGARNIPLSSSNFVVEMQKLRINYPNTKIVVYCNGKTCKKSYQAVKKCKAKRIPNVIAYDAGIMDWAKKYPKDSILLGTNPIDTKQLIAKTEFKKRLIGTKKFGQFLAGKNIIVLDVRDQFQREGLGLFPGIDKRVYLDDRDSIIRYVNKAKKERKTLLVYDATGKQVRWLMYTLESMNLKNYYFMEGGADAYYSDMRNNLL